MWPWVSARLARLGAPGGRIGRPGAPRVPDRAEPALLVSAASQWSDPPFGRGRSLPFAGRGARTGPRARRPAGPLLWPGRLRHPGRHLIHGSGPVDHPPADGISRSQGRVALVNPSEKGDIFAFEAVTAARPPRQPVRDRG